MSALASAYVPLSFAPGEAYQFDWSHEVVLIGGATVTVKVAHIRLCHSRMLFVRAYPRETQEMVFDAHERAFAFFRGACTRGIYDNLKAAVDAIFVGRERAYNRRFLQMGWSHYLVEPVLAGTPAAGWEKGQVENQVGLVRERFFTPRLRVKSFEELNAWLLDRCVAYALGAPASRTARADDLVGVRGRARPSLVPYAGRFDGFHAVPASVSKTCSCGSTTTATRCRRTRSGGRSRCVLMLNGSSRARTAGWSANIAAASAAIRPCSIPGITCRCWRASRARCATAPHSRTGRCRRDWHGFAASSPAAPMATGRWSRS